MSNVIFNYNGQKYITTFGLAWDKKCVPLAELPAELGPKIVSDLSAGIIMYNARAFKNRFGDVHAIGTVTIDGEQYRVDTEHEDHLIPMLPTPEIAAPIGVKEVITEPIAEPEPEPEPEPEVEHEPEPEPEPKLDLPDFLLELVDEWTDTAPDLDRLKEDGDAYCIENDWAYRNGYYLIDDIKTMTRYIHSDQMHFDMVVPYSQVQNSRRTS